MSNREYWLPGWPIQSGESFGALETLLLGHEGLSLSKIHETSNYDPRSGTAVVKVQLGQTVGYGSSRCHPTDKPQRSTGMALARVRALRDLANQMEARSGA